MANINLGNIRKLGFIRGLADAELARQAAEAKIAEEDRAYQRLLERDEALREYQSRESEKGRVFQADQAKILAEATKEAEDKKAKESKRRFGITSKHTESELELKRKQITNEETRLKRDEENKKQTRQRSELLHILGQNAKNGIKTDLKEMQVLYPLVLTVPTLVDVANINAGKVSDKEANAKAEAIHNDWIQGRITPETADQVYDALKKTNHYSIENMTKREFVADVARRYERNRLKENNLSPSTEQKFGNTTVQLTKPSIIDKRLKDLKGGHRVRARLTALQEDDIAIAASFKNTEITQDAKDQLKDYYINRFKNFQLGSEASRESQRDKGSLYRATRQNILNSTSMFKQTFTEKEQNEIFKEARIHSDVSKKPYEVKIEDAIKSIKFVPQVNEENYNNFSNDGERGKEILSMLRDPDSIEDKNSIEYVRSSLLRQLKLSGYKMTTTTSDSGERVVKALLSTFTNEKGQIDINALDKIGEALKTINTPDITTIDKNSGLSRTIPNPHHFLTKKESSEAAKSKDLAQKDIVNSREVIKLTKEIETLAKNTDYSAGQVGAIAGKLDTFTEIFKQGMSFFREKAQGLLDTVSFTVGNDKINLGTERKKALNGIESNANYTAEERKNRKTILANAEDRLAKNIKKYDKQLANNEITRSEAERRKLLDLKKIALTYRMSGILQGDSSGRTISNQDFDVALQAVWTEGAFLGSKMQDIRKFFEARVRVSETFIDYGNSGLADVMLSFANELNDRLSDDYIRSTIGKTDQEDVTSGTEVMPSFLRSVDDEQATPAQTKNIPKNQEFTKKIQEGVTQLAKIGENDPTLLSALKTSVEKGEALKYKIRMPRKGSGHRGRQTISIDLHEKLMSTKKDVPLGVIPQMILDHEKTLDKKLTKTQRDKMMNDLYFLYITSTIKQIEASTK